MISVLNHISGSHNCCEDSYFVRENEHFIYGGVFDGCSTGIQSKFASQLFAYAFESIESNPTSNETLLLLWTKLQHIKIALGLKNNQLWSTCVLFNYNKQRKRLKVRVIGDGNFYVNDTEHVIDTDDKVSYISDNIDQGLGAYYQWMQGFPIRRYDNVISFKICSDGIKQVSRSQFAPETTNNAMAMLMHPPTSPNYLARMWNILKRDHFTLSDDLTIISYVQD